MRISNWQLIRIFIIIGVLMPFKSRSNSILSGTHFNDANAQNNDSDTNDQRHAPLVVPQSPNNEWRKQIKQQHSRKGYGHFERCERKRGEVFESAIHHANAFAKHAAQYRFGKRQEIE